MQAPVPGQQQVSSYALIDRALAAGAIDTETAYKYRVFAAFGHPGLPEAYRGDDSAISEPPIAVLEDGARLGDFSAETRAALAPFFTTPSSPGSWVELRAVAGDGGSDGAGSVEHGPSAPDDPPSGSAPRSTPIVQWHTILAAGGAVKVWAQLRHAGDSLKAEKIAGEITSTIWRELVTLLGQPKSDAGEPLNSGGPELDIFLVRPSFTPANAAANMRTFGSTVAWRGILMPADPNNWKCKEGAFYILINSANPVGSTTSPGLLQDVTHELTHAITGAKPLKGGCQLYEWMREATAVWAEHRVYPKAQSEHGHAAGFLNDVSSPLDTYTPGPVNEHAYDSYLFQLYLQFANRERAIPRIWTEFATHSELEGVNEGLKAVGGDSLGLTFPKFAVANLNRPGADDYGRRDQVKAYPDIADSSDVTISPPAIDWEKAIDLDIKYLATKYTAFAFDPTVKMVTFENTLAAIDHAGVWVVEKMLGQWEKPVDISREYSRTWCRDHPLQDLESLIIVFTNNEWRNTGRRVDPSPPYRPMLRAYPDACGRGWTGTASTDVTITSVDPAITIHETSHSTIRFAVDPDLYEPNQPPEHWMSVGGHMSWRVEVSGECTGSASGGQPIPPLRDDHVATLSIFTDGGKKHVSGSNGPWPSAVPRYTITCPQGPVELIANVTGMTFMTDPVLDQLAPDGRSFSGHHTTLSVPGVRVVQSYSFRCSRSC